MKQLIWLAALLPLLVGCVTTEVQLAKAPDKLDYNKTHAAPAPSPFVPATGGIYNAVTYRPGFEDHRARMVGDVITVQITEQVAASQTNSTDINRDSNLNMSVTALPLFNDNSFARGRANANTSSSMNGEGSTSAAHTFAGNISAVVTDVLPNGHMVVVGEKQIGVNHNVDVLQFSGTVDPRRIRPGNKVLSTDLADVRVLSRSRGPQHEAQTFGWLSRFFLAVTPF